MNDKIEKSFQQLLQNQVTLLGTILKKSNYLQSLNQLLQQQLEASYHPYCHIANLRESTLILEIRSSAWATRLRFQLPELLNKLQQLDEFKTVKEITYYIQTPDRASDSLPKPTLQLSPETSAVISETARYIQDEGLKEALLKLVSNAEPRS